MRRAFLYTTALLALSACALGQAASRLRHSDVASSAERSARTSSGVACIAE